LARHYHSDFFFDGIFLVEVFFSAEVPSSTTLSSREDRFDDIRRQAASPSERQDAAMKEAQEAILGKLK